MSEIDKMDLIGFLRVRAWKIKRGKAKATPKKRFIDNVWTNVKP